MSKAIETKLFNNPEQLTAAAETAASKVEEMLNDIKIQVRLPGGGYVSKEAADESFYDYLAYVENGGQASFEVWIADREISIE
jgi:hypothetical protein